MREDDVLRNYCWPSIYHEDLFTAHPPPPSHISGQRTPPLTNLYRHSSSLSSFSLGFTLGVSLFSLWLGVKSPAACFSGDQLDLPRRVIVKHSPLRLWPYSLFILSAGRVRSEEAFSMQSHNYPTNICTWHESKSSTDRLVKWTYSTSKKDCGFKYKNVREKLYETKHPLP